MRELVNEINAKLEELMKAHNDRKAILNLPINMDDPKKKRGLDEEIILDALEKMRDYI